MNEAGSQHAPKGSVPVLQPKPQLKKPIADGVKPLTQAAPRAAVARPTPKIGQQSTAASVREAARTHANAKAENLVDLRAHSNQVAQQRYDTRLVDLICAELRAEFGEVDRPAANSNLDRPGPAAATAVQAIAPATQKVTPLMQAEAQHEAQVKAASAVELIEKIEAFVKSARPGIAITLDGSLGARVEIERLGPKEVAIRLVGSNGPPKPEDIGRIRDEMRARGLKVAALSVA